MDVSPVDAYLAGRDERRACSVTLPILPGQLKLPTYTCWHARFSHLRGTSDAALVAVNV